MNNYFLGRNPKNSQGLISEAQKAQKELALLVFDYLQFNSLGKTA